MRAFETVIPPRVWKSRNGWHMESTFRWGEQLVRVSIERDSYDFQSHARTLIFSQTNNEWNHFTSLPFNDCHSRELSAAERDSGKVTAFMVRDQTVLLDLARELLKVAHP